MAPLDDDSAFRRVQDDVLNPFIAFRRFADEQMSNLMSGIFGLSSSSSADSSKVQDYQAWLQGARSSRQSLEREAEEAGRIMDVYTRAFRDTAQETGENDNQNEDQPLRCPYGPDGEEVSQRHSNRPELGRPNFGTRQSHACPATPLIEDPLCSASLAYLLYSPYSPFKLEHSRTLCRRGIDWEEAFKDLLASQNEENKALESGDEELLWGFEWIKGLPHLAISRQEPINNLHKNSEAINASRSILNRFNGGRQSELAWTEQKNRNGEEDDLDDDNSDESMTEFDLYKHFLGAQEPPSNSHIQSQSRSSAHVQQDPSPFQEGSNKPNILSTLTTTERTTLQDGTIHTKVMLKKRFADGREESTETMHTQNPVPELQYQPPAKETNGSRSKEEPSELVSRAKENKNKGWFWS